MCIFIAVFILTSNLLQTRLTVSCLH